MADLIGQTIRSYQFLELIGSGGFGVVYRARQPSLNRQVAVKLILPSRAKSEYFSKRFDAEAHLVAKLEHPHIVPLYEYWHDTQGAALVMRWLPGGSLQQILEHAPLTLEHTFHLVEHIASALSLAHSHGVVHRDLKPANILLDNEGNFYLSDFGIAKDLIGDIYQSSGVGVTGSPAYLSPEQALSEPVTPLSDIYSFGVLLYEALTGEHPFPEVGTTAQILHHISDPLPSLREKRPDLPDALDIVIQTATQKSPADRYPDMTALSRAFRRALPPATITKSSAAFPPVAAPPARRFTFSRPLLGYLLAFLLVVVVPASAYLAWPYLFPEHQPAAPVPTPTPEDSLAVPTPFPTPPPYFETYSIGETVQGRPLNVLRIGLGARIVVIVAALHGDEQNASTLAEILSQRFQYKTLPEELTMYFLNAANPDGLFSGTRLNANAVDLNRNWETSNWQTETEGPSGTVSLGGGSRPFSEPETSAISAWLLELASASPHPLTILFYHSAYPPYGLVLPGYSITGGNYRPDPRASLFGVSYAYAVEADFSETWDDYIITGEAILWCGEQQMICLDIELPSKEALLASEILKHEAALFALVANTAP